MIEPEDMGKFDRKRLYSIYMTWQRHFRDALESLYVPSLSRHVDYYESLVFCGMGGSATSCDILQEIMNQYGSVPSTTLRSEKMPGFVNERSLVLVNSVSGNTTESIAMMKDAISHGAEVISISSGGKLKEETSRAGCEHIEIPNLSLPRASLPYLLVPGLMIINSFLSRSLMDEINSIPQNIDSIIRNNTIDVTEDSNIAKKIGRFIAEGFPFCYSSPALLPAATRFKNSLNENAKLHCIRESILEASHNDIVPFTFDHSSQVPRILHLRWSQDLPFVKERFNKVHLLLEKVVQPIMEITMSEKSLLSALISAIYVLDLSTIYIAIAKNTDPSPTPAIQLLKDI